jgi:hypothetical protein
MARFVARSDAELAAAVAAHPREMLGFVARLSRLQQRRAAQQQAMAALLERMHQAMLRAASASRPAVPDGSRSRPRIVALKR